MEANELRIGNYVFENNKIKQIYLVSNHNAKDYSKTQPIPLTEEWAVKFGFLKRWNAPAMIINYGELQSVFTLNIVNGEFYFTYGDLKVEYVHQLQNLYFALTNEELIIKE